MKNLIGLVIGLVLATRLLASESKTVESAVSVEFKTGVWSKYVDNDAYVYDDGFVSQSELTLQSKTGLYLNLWHSAGKYKSARELDYSVGFSYEGAVTIDVGYSYQDYDRFFKGPVGDVHEFYGKVSKEISSGDDYWSIAPSFGFESYKPGKGNDYEGGLRVIFGAEYSHQVLDAKLVGETAIVRDDGTFGSPSAWVVNQKLGLEWKAGKATIGLPRLAYYGGSHRSSSTVYGVDASFSF